MTKMMLLFVLPCLIVSCVQNSGSDKPRKPLTEFSDYYSDPTTEKLYSQTVGDTFKLFISTPKDYEKSSTETYPLILILDGNAFFESTVAELKFNSFVGLIPKSIVVGVGYKDFQTMDSLRSRDYTYPVAIPEYEMSLSGGADEFKTFIDDQLIPKLTRDYQIDIDKSVICGHSLGGYFAVYYGLKSIEENKAVIRNIVSASPSLHYNHRFLFEMERNLSRPATDLPLTIYISMGSDDMADDESKGILDSFERQISDRNYKGLKIQKAEYSNFGHLDAAIPGFIKGLTYVFESQASSTGDHKD